MYKIVDENGFRVINFKSNIFMEAFDYMNEHKPNSYILFQTKYNTQIVWNPLWEDIDCNKMV